MDKKTKIHDDIMSFLNDYLENTPKETIQKEFAAISQKEFDGITAKDYFENFHDYYQGIFNVVATEKSINDYLLDGQQAYTYKNIFASAALGIYRSLYYVVKDVKAAVELSKEDYNLLNSTYQTTGIRTKKYDYV